MGDIIGKVELNCILENYQFCQYHRLCKVLINGIVYGFLLRKYVEIIPLLLDRIKPYLNVISNSVKILFVRGSLTDKEPGSEWIAYYAYPVPISNNGTIHFPVKFVEIPTEKDTRLVEEVRKILIFREVMAVKQNFLSHIWVGKNLNGSFYLLSLNETGLDYLDDGLKMARNAYDSLFTTRKMSHILKNQLGILQEDQIRAKVFAFRSAVCKTIEKYDQKFLTTADEVPKRIRAILEQF